MADTATRLLQTFQDGFVKGEPFVISIFVAVVIGFLTLLWLIIKATSRNKRQGVLLVGICGAGKTLIYSQLVHKMFQDSYTSIQTNFGTYITSQKKNLQIVDLPGHERLRVQLLEKHKGATRAIVFVVDSSTLQKEVKEVAEFLYTLLSDRTLQANGTPVLVLCNKQDLNVSKGSRVIRSQLEKEMNTLRVTKGAALQGIGEVSSTNTVLGKPGKDFEFSDLKANHLDFAEGCSLDTKDLGDNTLSLEALHSWLAKVA